MVTVAVCLMCKLLSFPAMASSHVFVEGADFGPPPVTLPAVQIRNLLCHGDILVDHLRRSGPVAGIFYTDDGGIRLQLGGAFWVHRSKNSAVGGKATIRSAQYISGIIGLLILYGIFLFDRSANNLRDFAINFASDIFAVSMVLIVGEYIDSRRSRARAALEVARVRNETNIYDQPFESTL